MNLVPLAEAGQFLGDRLTVAGTGHRPQDIAAYDHRGFTALVDVARAMIVLSGATTVIAGGALGWDTALAAAALDLGLPLLLVLPFPGQERRWPRADQLRYKQQREAATAVFYLSEETPGDDTDAVIALMNARNAFMVDHADQVLAFWSGTPRGGTANCVAYAKRVRTPVVNGWTADWGMNPPAKLPSTVNVQISVDARGYEVLLSHEKVAPRVSLFRAHQTFTPHAVVKKLPRLFPAKKIFVMPNIVRRERKLRQTVLYYAASGPSAVRRDWKPKQGRRTGPSNPGRLFLIGLLRAVEAVKKADYLRFDLTHVQLAQVRALRADAARGFYDQQPGASNVGTRIIHALLKEKVVTALGRFPHNLGEFGVKSASPAPR